MEKKRTQFEINMQINFENLSELDQFDSNRFGGKNGMNIKLTEEQEQTTRRRKQNQGDFCSSKNIFKNTTLKFMFIEHTLTGHPEITIKNRARFVCGEWDNMRAHYSSCTFV